MGRVGVWMLLTACLGCGTEGYQVAPVSGRVTVDGKPVAGLTVTFEPVGSRERPNPGPGAVGATDDEGRFRLATVPDGQRGAVVGPCRVRILVVVREAASASQWMDPPVGKAKQPVRHLPLRYNDETKLKYDVPRSGTSTANFELTWH